MDKSKKPLYAVSLLLIVCAFAMAVILGLLEKRAEISKDIPTSSAESSVSETKDEKNRATLGGTGSPIRIKKSESAREGTPEELAKYPQLTNLPTLYIELDDDADINRIQKEVHTPATYTIVENGYGVFEQKLDISGRGNFSWGMEKKPFNLHLATETDLLGMGCAKRWVLLSNWSDKTLMRNYVVMKFADEIGMEYSPDCKYVDLYVNGEYRGNYLLTEKIQIHEERVNITAEESALFEIEKKYRHNNCDYCIESSSGVHIMYSAPDPDDLDDATLRDKLKRYEVFFTKVDVAFERGYEYYSKILDVDSFIDWYIISEFVKNYDSNFTTSCYCYIGDDEKLHMGPVWDYDTCMGNQDVATGINPEGYHIASQAAWYQILTGDSDFYRLLCERWTELVDNGKLEWFFNQFTEMDEYIHESEVLDHQRWPGALKYGMRGNATSTHKDEVEYVINFMSARYNWLCEQWYLGDEIPYREVHTNKYFNNRGR